MELKELEKMYIASYEVQIKNRNKLERMAKDSNYFAKLGNCLTWLNSRFDSFYEELYNKEAFFVWSIKGSRNSEEPYEEFRGLFEIRNESFIEKVLDFESIKQKLEEFKK